MTNNKFTSSIRTRLWFGSDSTLNNEESKENDIITTTISSIIKAENNKDNNNKFQNKEFVKACKKNILQIQLDVPRTWPSHPMFARSRHKIELEKLLVTWCLSANNNSATNCYYYIQGMNFLGAMCYVAASGNTDLAFIGLSRILQVLDPIYSNITSIKYQTIQLQQQIYQRDEELAQLLFEKLDVNLLALTPSYFLTCFFTSLNHPINAFVIMDKLFECIEQKQDVIVLLRKFASEIIVAHKMKLFQCKDEGEVLVCLKYLDMNQELFDKVIFSFNLCDNQEGDSCNNIAKEEVAKDKDDGSGPDVVVNVKRTRLM
jgi:hypothetical protein